MPNEPIDNSFGNSFPPPNRYAGFIFLLVGSLWMLSIIPDLVEDPGNMAFVRFGVSFLLLLGGALTAHTLHGVEIDPESERFRSYTKYMGLFKVGKWQSLDSYPYITVLKTTKAYRAHSRGSVPLSQREHYYDIYLLDPGHRSKVPVERLEGNEEAWEQCEELSGLLGLESTRYSPKGSEKGRKRGGKRRR